VRPTNNLVRKETAFCHPIAARGVRPITKIENTCMEQHPSSMPGEGPSHGGRGPRAGDAALARHEEIFMSKPGKKYGIPFDMNAEHGG
jgi:hypothetical protein